MDKDPTILLIDDDERVLNATQAMLQSEDGLPANGSRLSMSESTAGAR